MSEPTYLPVKTVRNYKVTVVEQKYEVHKGTNTVLEDSQDVILDEAIFKATSAELAKFMALTQIAEVGECDMSNLKVTCDLF